MSEEFKIANVLMRRLKGNAPVVRVSDQETRERQRKVAFSVGSILLVLLLISVFFGWKRRTDAIRQQKLSAIEGRIHFVIEQAQGLSAFSPGRARSLVLGAQKSLEEERSNTRDDVIRARLIALSKELETALNTSGRAIAAIPDVYLDLGLIREGTTGSAMAISGDALFVVDKGSSVLLSVSAVSRSGEVIGGGDALSGGRTVSGSGKHGYVLTDRSVVQVLGDTKTSTVVISDNESLWKDPIGIASFSGNIYILDRGASEIYKYPSTGSTGSPQAGSEFGTRTRWLSAGVTPDLSQAQSFAVDGDAWVLLHNGNIKRFRRGSPINFSESGAEDVEEAVSLSVPMEGTRVWVLDRGAGRVVAFDRESGEYAGQWTSDMMKSATSIAVSEELGKIFLLAGKHIYVTKIR